MKRNATESSSHDRRDGPQAGTAWRQRAMRHPLTWDYLRLMSTPNHRRHFSALGATASGIKVSSGGREGILFDHLVGDGEQRRWHLDAEHPGRCGSEQPASGNV